MVPTTAGRLAALQDQRADTTASRQGDRRRPFQLPLPAHGYAEPHRAGHSQRRNEDFKFPDSSWSKPTRRPQAAAMVAAPTRGVFVSFVGKFKGLEPAKQGGGGDGTRRHTPKPCVSNHLHQAETRLCYRPLIQYAVASDIDKDLCTLTALQFDADRLDGIRTGISYHPGTGIRSPAWTWSW